MTPEERIYKAIDEFLWETELDCAVSDHMAKRLAKKILNSLTDDEPADMKDLEQRIKATLKKCFTPMIAGGIDFETLAHETAKAVYVDWCAKSKVLVANYAKQVEKLKNQIALKKIDEFHEWLVKQDFEMEDERVWLAMDIFSRWLKQQESEE